MGKTTQLLNIENLQTQTSTVKELRTQYDMTQKEFSDFLHIPKRTIENWEAGKRKPPEYLVELMAFKLDNKDKELT